MKAEANILILNRNSREREFLCRLLHDEGCIQEAASLDRALALSSSVVFHAVITDSSFADHSSLAGIIDPRAVLFFSCGDEKRIKEILKDWPSDQFIISLPFPILEAEQTIFLRTLRIALRSRVPESQEELPSITESVEYSPDNIQSLYQEIREIKNFISSSVVRELEKRIELEIKYISSQREKQKIELILKKLYAAGDVNSLLDIVPDIKEIVQARGITFSILDENDSLGQFLKPLVWDDTFLSHQDFSKYIALIDADDFAAWVARRGECLNLVNPRIDKRMSKRYSEHLKNPLKSLLAVPIMHDEGVIGVLDVYNKEPRSGLKNGGFKKEDQEILRRLSEHISIAMTKLNLIQYDALTGLLRPDPFFEKVIQKINSQSKRRQEAESYAVVMGDVDWFKNYNDRNGHESGNRLLRELANILKASLREEDLICRYGGEEFLFFLTGVKNMEEACILTERIRRNVEEHYFENQEFQPRKNLTMSFGVTLSPRTWSTSEETITKADLKRMAHEADMALAEAKGKRTQGVAIHGAASAHLVKNKVCVFDRENLSRMAKSSFIKPYEEKFYQEKRKQERHFISTFLLFSDNGGFKVSKTVNLSLGGVKIHSDSQLTVSKTFEVFLLMDNRASYLKGDVVYSEKTVDDPPSFTSGLRFRDLSTHNRKMLEDYLSAFGKKGPLN